MAPRARFELATLRLTAECSTIELPGNCGQRNSCLSYDSGKGCATEAGRARGASGRCGGYVPFNIYFGSSEAKSALQFVAR